MPVRPDDVTVAFRSEVLQEALAICLGRPAGDLARSRSVHLRGVLARRRGLADLALAYFRRSCALDPSNPASLHDLGDALSRQGFPEAGLGAHLRALTLAPCSAQSYQRLATVLHQQQHETEAAAMCQRALDLRADEASAYVLLGDIRKAQGRHAAALHAYAKACELAPGDPDLHRRLGRSYVELKEDHRAIDALERGLGLAPDDVMLNVELGEILIRRNQADEALRRLDIALRYSPDDVRANRLRMLALQLKGRRLDIGAAWIGLAAALETQHRFREAAASYQQACVNPAERLRAERGLARIQGALGAPAEAVRHLEAAVALDAEHAAAHVELGLALQQLEIGDRAWDELAWFHHPSAAHWMHVEQPVWNGAALNGQIILLWTAPEGSVAETLLSLRYVQFAKLRGGRVMVQCDRTLAPLVKQCAGVDHVVATGGPLLPFSVHAPLLHLPSLVTPARSTFCEVPYLSTQSELSEHWLARLGRSLDRDRLYVGIAWADENVGGVVNQGYQALHRASLAALEPLAAHDELRIVSLQRGEHAHELLASAYRGRITSLLPESPRHTDLAALISCLDLVITVDTAVAHLAGALGVPVWTLLPHGPAWPWPASGDETQWYPTMRLFRQRQGEDWTHVVRNVADALKDVIPGKGQTIRAPREPLVRVRESSGSAAQSAPRSSARD